MAKGLIKPTVDAAAADDFIFAAPPPREAWLGRLRYVIVPIIAVLTIATAIYWLEDANGDLGDKSAVGADQTASGAASPVQFVPLTDEAAKTPAPRIGSPAPGFTLNGLDGKPVKLSDFRGQTVFLNFFASWCAPCRTEMPDIRDTYLEMKDNGVVVLAVDMQEEAGVVRDYATAAGLSFPVALDRAGAVTSLYRITAIPTSFFIGKDGVVRDMQIGAMSKSLMRQRLQKAL